MQAHVDSVPERKSSASLNISVSQGPRAEPKSFYVVIDQADDGGAVMGVRTLTMVTLLPSE